MDPHLLQCNFCEPQRGHGSWLWHQTTIFCWFWCWPKASGLAKTAKEHKSAGDDVHQNTVKGLGEFCWTQRNLNGWVRKMNEEHGDGRRTQPAMHIGSVLSCSRFCAALKHVRGPLNPSLSENRSVWDKRFQVFEEFGEQIKSDSIGWGSFLKTFVVYVEWNTVFAGDLCVPLALFVFWLQYFNICLHT